MKTPTDVIHTTQEMRSTIGVVGTFLRGVREQFPRAGLIASLLRKRDKITWVVAYRRAHDIMEAEYRRDAMGDVAW